MGGRKIRASKSGVRGESACGGREEDIDVASATLSFIHFLVPRCKISPTQIDGGAWQSNPSSCPSYNILILARICSLPEQRRLTLPPSVWGAAESSDIEKTDPSTQSPPGYGFLSTETGPLSGPL
jgi:hypothetical protein